MGGSRVVGDVAVVGAYYQGRQVAAQARISLPTPAGGNATGQHLPPLDDRCKKNSSSLMILELEKIKIVSCIKI